MRFDPARVVARSPGSAPDDKSPEQAEAALAEALTASGWRIERVPTRPRPRRLVLIGVVAFVGFGFLAGRVAPDAGVLARTAIAGAFVGTLAGLTGFLAARRGRASGPEAPVGHLFGTRPAGTIGTARLVLVARLGRSGRVAPSWSLIGAAAALMLAPAALLVFWTNDLARRHPWAGWGVLIAEWLGLLVVADGLATPGPGPGPDRAALAMLAELARTWPKGASDRVETWFIATPDPADLSRELQRRFRDEIPTLALTLESPGMGPEIVVGGRGPAAVLASEAASALWVPHRRLGRFRGGFGRSGFRGSAIARVGLGGTHDGRGVDPAALDRCAQLVLEIALRWGKRARAADHDQDSDLGASRARSSQKPG